MKLVIIMNRGSGKNHFASKYESLKSAAIEHGLDPDFILVSNGEEATKQAKAAVRKGAAIVCAAGGDGTISAVAAGVVDTGSALGVLPLGTFNHFAIDLGIPTEMGAALEVVKNGAKVQVDVGDVNKHIFINNSSIGLYPRIVHERDADRARRKGTKLAALIRAGFKILRKYPTLSLKIKLEGREMMRKTAFVFVGNNEYILEGLRMGKRSNITDGRLNVGVAHRTHRMDLFRMFAKALFGRLRSEAYFDQYKVLNAQIDSRKRYLPVSLDGEVKVLRTPLHYHIRPKALKVIVPRKIA